MWACGGSLPRGAAHPAVHRARSGPNARSRRGTRADL